MTTYDKMMHVKELLATSATNVPYTIANNLNLENISKLIADSKAKVVNLLNRQSSYFKPVIMFDSLNKTLTYNAGNRNNSQLVQKNQMLSIDNSLFTSMVDLTNFLLYENEKNIFELDDVEKSNVEYFSSEIDFIQKDLLDISDTINRMKVTYKNYCENLLNLCDRKDELCEMFLDYYEEYYGDEEYSAVVVRPTERSSTKAIRSSTSSSQGTNLNVTASAKKTRKQSARKVSHSSGESELFLEKTSSTKPASKKEQANKLKETTPLITAASDFVESKDGENESENEDVMREGDDKALDNMRYRNTLVRRKSSRMYLYSIPTENRFSILS
jgi:hypothetical protein